MATPQVRDHHGLYFQTSSFTDLKLEFRQIAGVVALILSARGKNFTAQAMRSRLATTTKLLNRVNSPSIESQQIFFAVTQPFERLQY